MIINPQIDEICENRFKNDDCVREYVVVNESGEWLELKL